MTKRFNKEWHLTGKRSIFYPPIEKNRVLRHFFRGTGFFQFIKKICLRLLFNLGLRNQYTNN